MELKRFESELFGKLEDGTDVTLYTIRNSKKMEITLLNLGATLQSVIVPDKIGNPIDVALGYDNPNNYLERNKFLGAIVGRNANRIVGASFTLNGEKYELTRNNGKNNIHSGLDFYKNRIWEVKEKSENSITFTLFSPEGDQGFPGNLQIDVKYTLTEKNELCISYHGTADKDTIVNLTNHSYFNLEGHASGSVLNQKVWIDADAFTMADRESIPTGEITSVENTPMDFCTKKKLAEDFYADYAP